MGWIAVDLVGGHVVPMERFPFILGAGDAVDFRCLGQGLPEQAMQIQEHGKGIQLDSLDRDGIPGAEIDGEYLRSGEVLQPGAVVCLKIGATLILLAHAKDPDRWLRDVQPFAFTVQTRQGVVHETYSGEQLSQQLDSNPSWASDGVVQVKGTSATFRPSFWRDCCEASREVGHSWTVANVAGDSHTCPFCWEKFSSAEVKAIAVHEDLRGDSFMGPDAMLRFQPTSFDSFGHPTDGIGLPCPERACPRCHQKLPPNFLESIGQIISLVGDARAGKSYLLAVLAHYLPNCLARGLNLRWEDHDPEGNILLNDLKDRLLSAGNPESAAIEKTSVGGVTYINVQKNGRTFQMPRPFTYRISRDGHPPFVGTFYDNAGEHFTPRVATDQNPGALHVAQASAIMFLFGPLLSPEIKDHLKKMEAEDPQLYGIAYPDNQAVILAEMKVRIGRIKNLSSDESLNVPFAFIIGKYDAWKDIYKDNVPTPLPVVRNGKLDLEAIEQNSWQARFFLEQFCPAVVKNAEALAPNIKFFPASSFGHAPSQTSKGFAPDPQRIRPILIEAPILWILRQLRPDLVPVC